MHFRSYHNHQGWYSHLQVHGQPLLAQKLHTFKFIQQYHHYKLSFQQHRVCQTQKTCLYSSHLKLASLCLLIFTYCVDLFCMMTQRTLHSGQSSQCWDMHNVHNRHPFWTWWMVSIFYHTFLSTKRVPGPQVPRYYLPSILRRQYFLALQFKPLLLSIPP